MNNERGLNKSSALDSKNGISPKLFELNWGWHEDWESYLFIHYDKTQKQFKKDVSMLLVKYGNEYLESEDSFAGASSWISFIADKMPELGYQPIQPINVGFCGSYIIEGDEEDVRGWGKVVGEDLLQKAIEHNIKVRDRLLGKSITDALGDSSKK